MSRSTPLNQVAAARSIIASAESVSSTARALKLAYMMKRGHHKGTKSIKRECKSKVIDR
jgi:hypothetical protein